MIAEFCVKTLLSIFGILNKNPWDVWRPLLLIWKTILTCIVKISMTWMASEGCQQVTGKESSSSGLSTACFPFPASTKKEKKKRITQRGSCGAQCHWEVEAEQIRKGQERGSQLQGNKGKPIPGGIILTLETRDPGNSGSMSFSAWGGRGRRRGGREGRRRRRS